jgi:hypothetical protein
MGRFFAPDGNMTDWWDEYTIRESTRRSQCFVSQFDAFTVPAASADRPPPHVDGSLTLDENVADTRGLRAAYHAWVAADRASPDQRLPGLEAWPKEQVFFLAYGNWWCSLSKAATLRSYVRTNNHAPHFARLMVSLLPSIPVAPPSTRGLFGAGGRFGLSGDRVGRVGPRQTELTRRLPGNDGQLARVSRGVSMRGQRADVRAVG